jgi:hypothetical protein
VTSAPFSSHFLASSSDQPPLRIGLLLDGPTLTRADASIVRDLQASNFARIELLVFDASRTTAPATSGGWRAAVARLGRLRAEGGTVFAAWAMLDRLLAGGSDDPLGLEDCRAMLDGIPSLNVTPMPTPGTFLFPFDQLEGVRAQRLDVIVQLGFPRLEGPIHSMSRFGVWAFHNGEGVQYRRGVRYRGGPAGFWELVEGNPVCAVVLRREGDGVSEGLVLDRAVFATDPTSLARTRRTAIYGSTHLLIRNLRLLHERGWSWIEAHAPADPAVPAHRSSDPVRPINRWIDRRPATLDVVRWFVPLVVRKVLARFVRLFTRADDVLHWRIAIRVGGPGIGLDRRPDLTGFRWVESPPGHFYADPFVVQRDGRRWLFLEDYAYERDAAVIACAELADDGRLGTVRPVLESTGHLSYPLIVEDGADAVLIPESSAAGAVRAYRTTAFPDGWTMAAELLPESAVDTSVWARGGRWWFFTTVQEPRGGAGMLMLYHAPAVDGAWTPHPLNPISQDVRTNRGGGGLFLDGDRLVRPSQDGSRGYGYSLTFNEITVLSELEYAERPGPTIIPDWEPGLLGIHTYNHVGDIEVIDGKVARPRSSVA